jgi:hypothetical protein
MHDMGDNQGPLQNLKRRNLIPHGSGLEILQLGIWDRAVMFIFQRMALLNVLP